ncbi:hexose kinase [Nocardia uniformis]|uniref:Hexose kinase n=1 Tax=Nocardia uniformis TaxID=53432 RepID=A0A849CGG6_9NOCA|nr:hexose kinase [Nocardia uniformis]NNH74819.1 hexose kinase [Nocardia uniformis]
MILTVTLNPAYDITYGIDRLKPGTVHRVASVRQRVGGKGVNVARVLHSLGVSVLATGLASTEFAVEAEHELPADFVLGLPWVRRTIVIQETGDGHATTGLWEPGATPDASAVDRLSTRVRGLLGRTRGLVISGSLPPHVDSELPALLARMAVGAGIPTICDVSGAALRHAARVPGVVLMPNADELSELTGTAPHSPAEVVAAAQPLLDAGVGAVIATRGADGMVAATGTGSWSAVVSQPITGNTTGAGDAAAAAVITGLAADRMPEVPALLAAAVATSAASVAAPLAGEIDHRLRERLLPTVPVRRVPGPEREEKP